MISGKTLELYIVTMPDFHDKISEIVCEDARKTWKTRGNRKRVKLFQCSTKKTIKVLLNLTIFRT